MDISKILTLQVYLYIPVISGYFAYLIAIHGRRKEEKKIDAAMGTIAFGTPAWFLFYLANQNQWGTEWIIIASIVSLILCLLMGIYWRDTGRGLFYSLLNMDGISNDIGISSAWSHIIQSTDVIHKQIEVITKSGSIYHCEDVPAFIGLPIKGWSLDDDGNIAMYATHIDGERVNYDPEQVKDWGNALIYIPADQVELVEFRLKKKPV